eukprot:6295120-Prymnesium_polylepis.1
MTTSRETTPVSITLLGEPEAEFLSTAATDAFTVSATLLTMSAIDTLGLRRGCPGKGLFPSPGLIGPKPTPIGPFVGRLVTVFSRCNKRPSAAAAMEALDPPGPGPFRGLMGPKPTPVGNPGAGPSVGLTGPKPTPVGNPGAGPSVGLTGLRVRKQIKVSLLALQSLARRQLEQQLLPESEAGGRPTGPNPTPAGPFVGAITPAAAPMTLPTPETIEDTMPVSSDDPECLIAAVADARTTPIILLTTCAMPVPSMLTSNRE